MTLAYQLEEVGTRLSRTTIERRPLGPRDVRLDLKFCGICHSDLVAASDKLGGGIFPMVPARDGGYCQRDGRRSAGCVSR